MAEFDVCLLGIYIAFILKVNEMHPFYFFSSPHKELFSSNELKISLMNTPIFNRMFLSFEFFSLKVLMDP